MQNVLFNFTSLGFLQHSLWLFHTTVSVMSAAGELNKKTVVSVTFPMGTPCCVDPKHSEAIQLSPLTLMFSCGTVFF